MKKYKIGQHVRVGESKGCIMTITKIKDKNMTLVDGNSTFYFHEGDCTLIPIKEFEQLKLF